MFTMISLTFSFLFFFSLFTSNIKAYNITEILNQHPDFTKFNDQLTQTQLATTINARRTITVLVVDNGALSGISGMSTGEVKKVLSLHVVLDYYDMQKLEKLSGKFRILTTLFQASGQAKGQQGFLNATKTQNGVVLGSAVAGSSLNSNVVRSVAAQPYNISVIQVSSVIVPPNLSNSTATPPSKSPTPATAPAPSINHAPAPKNNEAGSPASEANAPSNAPSKANSPLNAPSGSPTNAPFGAPTNAPSSDGPASDEPTKGTSSGSGIIYFNSLGFGIGAVMWGLIVGAL